MKFVKQWVAGVVATVALSISSSAMLFDVDEVLPGNGSFGASLFHTNAGMSGSIVATITGVDASGVNTYNDATGFLDVLLSLSVNGTSAGTVRLHSTGVEALKFGGPNAGGLRDLVDGGTNNGAVAGQLWADFSAPPPELADAVLNFTSGLQCCASVGNYPNSLGPAQIASVPDSSPQVMTLWGSNGQPIVNASGSVDWLARMVPAYGLDLRLGLSPTAVPSPDTLGLFTAGVLALLWIRRRRSS